MRFINVLLTYLLTYFQNVLAAVVLVVRCYCVCVAAHQEFQNNNNNSCTNNRCHRQCRHLALNF